MCECKTPPPRAGNPLAAVYILVFCFLIRSPVYLAAQDESITIMAVGDIMLARGLSPLLEKNGHQYPFKNTGKIFENADVVIGNLECYISSQSLNAGNVFNFRASTSSVTGLKKAGFNVLTLANNHIFDGGCAGMKDTVKILREHNIAYSGVGSNKEEAIRPAVIKAGNKKIAIVACTTLMPKGLIAANKTPGVVSADMLEPQIKKLRVYYDYIVVSCHWGEELTQKPLKDDIRIAHALIDAGAELVVGHHPHVIQGIEIYKGRPVIYSLGNFIFDNPSESTRESFIMKYTILPRSKRLSIIPIERKSGVARVPEGAKALDIANKVKAASHDFNTRMHFSPDYFSVQISSVNTYMEVDKTARRLTLYREENAEFSCSVAVGMDDCTPLGRFIVTNKTLEPSWLNDGNEIVMGGSPDNPLGKCWMGIDRWNLNTGRQYGIHGTNDETRIGKESSRGCIELSNENIQKLLKLINTGTEVFVLKSNSQK